MNSADLAGQLKDAAAKATPGPWNTWNDGDSWSVATMSMTTKNTICYIYGNRAQSQKPNDARFIALCSPNNITSLLDRIEALEAWKAGAMEALRLLSCFDLNHATEHDDMILEDCVSAARRLVEKEDGR